MNWLSLQTFAQLAVERIVNSLPEGLLIALFAWGLLRVLRRQNSGTRFAVWFLALLSVAALPLLTGFSDESAVLANAAAKSWGNLRPAVTVPSHWALYLFIVWAVGACVGMARLLAGIARLRQLRQSCTVIAAADLDRAVRQTLEQTAKALGSVTIATSEQVRVPAAIGFWNRTVVLPAWALRELSPSDLNVILLHEFAHLRRSDDWTNLIQKIVGALFFFHPAVWWIETQLSVEREMACDDAVLAETANPRGYATCLVSLLEKSLAHQISAQSSAQKNLSRHGWSMTQAVVHRAREASLRLAQILDSNRSKATRVWTPALSFVSAFALICMIALPHAPQVVAFDGGMVPSTIAMNQAHAPKARATEIPAPVVEASYKDSDKPTLKVALSKLIHAQPHRQPAQVVARWDVPNEIASGESTLPALFQVDASDQQGAPQFQNLVYVERAYVESTQYVISDSQLWRVQVWRVTTFSPMGERSMRIPVVNSI